MWLTLIVAETISASSGLGYMAMQAREFLLIDVVVLSILIYALLGKLADTLRALSGTAVPAMAPCLSNRLRSKDDRNHRPAGFHGYVLSPLPITAPIPRSSQAGLPSPSATWPNSSTASLYCRA